MRRRLGYFRYIKPVIRQNSDWGIYISIYACNYCKKLQRKKHALIKVRIMTGKEKLQNRCKEKSRNKKCSLVISIV